MSVLSSVAVAAEDGHHVVNELIMPAPVFAVISLSILVVLTLVTFSYRDVANRHSEKAERWARDHGVESDGDSH